jgi:hypothetical protein
MRARSTRLADSVRDRASRSNSDRSSSNRDLDHPPRSCHDKRLVQRIIERSYKRSAILLESLAYERFHRIGLLAWIEPPPPEGFRAFSSSLQWFRPSGRQQHVLGLPDEELLASADSASARSGRATTADCDAPLSSALARVAVVGGLGVFRPLT